MNGARSLTCRSAHSAMDRPPTSESRAASFSREPPHAGHGPRVEMRSTAARACGCSCSGFLVRTSRFSLGTSASYVSDIPETATLVPFFGASSGP